MQTFVGILVLGIIIYTSASSTSRIVGGRDSVEAKYPYQASLWSRELTYVCGGSIINELYILTAAHCLRGVQPNEFFVGVGNYMLNETRAGHLLAVDKIVDHKGFDLDGAEDDIGVIRLAEKILYNKKVQPIALPTSDFTYVDYPVVLSGWGRLQAGDDSPNVLQEIDLKIVSQERCLESFPGVTKTQICTLTEAGEGACHGDSGSPLAADGILVGIVSYGNPCGMGDPDVYTRVYSYLDWIGENMNFE